MDKIEDKKIKQTEFIGKGNIIVFTNKKLSNIKRNWIFVPTLVMVNLLFTILLVGFYTIPFINYGVVWLKILLGILWLFGAALFCDMAFTTNKEGKNEILVKIFTCLFQIVPLVAIFIHNNLHSFGESITVFKIVLLLCFMLFCILALVIIAKKQPKIFLVSLTLFIVGFLFFCLYYGAINNDVVDETVRKYVAIISVLGMTALILGFIVGVFLNSDKFKYIFIYSSLFFGVLVILLFISYSINYFDQNVDIMSAFVPLLSATIGGGLTLFGVAWTIKKSDKDRKEEEINRVKPYLKNYLRSYQLDNDVRIECVDLNQHENYKCQPFVLYIKNISQSVAVITGFEICDQYYPINNIALESNGKIQFQIKYYIKELSNLTKVRIIAQDIFGNYYEYDINSKNICETYEDAFIELPKEIEEPIEYEKCKEK